MTELKRLNKFISETGFCSRREADKYIEEGRVTVNGSLPEMGVKVSDADDVLIDGKWVAPALSEIKQLFPNISYIIDI